MKINIKKRYAPIKQISNYLTYDTRNEEHTNGTMINIVIGSNHAQVQWRKVHFVFYGNTFGLLQVGQRSLHQFTQMVTEMTMSDAL